LEFNSYKDFKDNVDNFEWWYMCIFSTFLVMNFDTTILAGLFEINAYKMQIFGMPKQTLTLGLEHF